MHDDKPEMIDTNEVARRTGMSVAWVLKARIIGGGPPFVKLGAAVRYPVAELDVWLRERTYSSNHRKAQPAQAAA